MSRRIDVGKSTCLTFEEQARRSLRRSHIRLDQLLEAGDGSSIVAELWMMMRMCVSGYGVHVLDAIAHHIVSRERAAGGWCVTCSGSPNYVGGVEGVMEAVPICKACMATIRPYGDMDVGGEGETDGATETDGALHTPWKPSTIVEVVAPDRPHVHGLRGVVVLSRTRTGQVSSNSYVEYLVEMDSLGFPDPEMWFGADELALASRKPE